MINTAERPSRASTSAIGTPSSRQSAVLAPAVLRLSMSAVVDDSLVINARSAATPTLLIELLSCRMRAEFLRLATVQ